MNTPDNNKANFRISNLPKWLKKVNSAIRLYDMLCLRALFISCLKLIGRSDIWRWSNKINISIDWDDRTKKLAKLIPAGSSVLEFGAGRMSLPNYLPEGCSYTPSDLVDRGNDTLVCDLNAKNLPIFPKYDVVVFSGVLEYVTDVPRLISHISNSCHTIVASYAITDAENQKSRVKRRGQGWVNDYSSFEIEQLLSKVGFLCQHVEEWGNQRLYKFVRK